MSPAAIRSLEASKKIIFGLVIPQLISDSTATDGAIIKTVDIQFSGDRPPLYASAFEEGGKKVIEISDELLLLVTRITSARVVSWYKANRGATRWLSFMDEYLVDVSRKIAAQEEVPSILTFTKLTVADIHDVEIWPDRDRVLNFSVTAALAWIVAHEMAHHVYGDPKALATASATQLREYETRADEWATAVTIKAKLFPSAAGELLGLFAIHEDGSNPQDHPEAGCRLRELGSALAVTFTKEIDKADYKRWLTETFPGSANISGFESLNAINAPGFEALQQGIFKQYKCASTAE